MLVVLRFSNTLPISLCTCASERPLPHQLSPLVASLKADTGILRDSSDYIPPIKTGLPLLDSPN